MDSSFIHKAILFATIAIMGILLVTTVVVAMQNDQSAESAKIQEPSLKISGPFCMDYMPYLMVELEDERIASVYIENNGKSRNQLTDKHKHIPIGLDEGWNHVVVVCYDKDEKELWLKVTTVYYEVVARG